MTGTTIHLPGSTWEVHPQEADRILERLEEAAAGGTVLTVRVLGDGGAEGVLVVAPAAVPVVVTGARTAVPLEMGFPQHIQDVVDDVT